MGFFDELLSKFFIFVGARHDSTEIPSSWDCVGGAASQMAQSPLSTSIASGSCMNQSFLSLCP